MSRIAPDGQLEFVRNTKTGRVHVRPHVPKPWEDGYEDPEPIPAGYWGATMAAVVTGPGWPMLCGHRMKYGYPGAPADYVAGDGFADGDLCIPCVKALGDEQWRAFHRNNREDAP